MNCKLCQRSCAAWTAGATRFALCVLQVYQVHPQEALQIVMVVKILYILALTLRKPCVMFAWGAEKVPHRCQRDRNVDPHAVAQGSFLVIRPDQHC